MIIKELIKVSDVQVQLQSSRFICEILESVECTKKTIIRKEKAVEANRFTVVIKVVINVNYKH